MNELTLLNTLFGNDSYGLSFPSISTSSMPKVDVTETKDSYVLDMELPGRTENDVSIDLNNRVLTIASVKEENKEKKESKDEAQYLIRERRYSEFQRRFTLPDDINEEEINASFKNGILTVTVPRKEVKAARKITITAA